MADEGLIREALAEVARIRQRRGKTTRMVRFSDLDKELAQRALAELGEKDVDE